MSTPQTESQADLRAMVENLTATVASLASRLPPLPEQEVDVSTFYLEDDAASNPVSSRPPTPTGSPPPTGLDGEDEEGDSEAPPGADNWLTEGRPERCRKALVDFPRLRLPFLIVPDLNVEMKSLVREAARDRRRTGTEPDLDTGVGQRDQALRDAQAAISSAVSPLVALLEKCADQGSAPTDTLAGSNSRIERRVVADHLAASLSQLGRLFAFLGNERRESVLFRIAPELRSFGTQGSRPEDEGADQLFGKSFLEQIKTRNATFQALREARQGTARGSTEEPAVKRSRLTPPTSTIPRRPAQPFQGRPFPGGYQGRATRNPRGRGRV
ncbi:uncharacterized protein LOC135393520 [Ornithodoros turicata]|uniref:uncharacterized protein LOC135393520 n=1 Tax=Ornithodoros turicata TaxID=34597 RepID=UPI003139EFA7